MQSKVASPRGWGEQIGRMFSFSFMAAKTRFHVCVVQGSIVRVFSEATCHVLVGNTSDCNE